MLTSRQQPLRKLLSIIFLSVISAQGMIATTGSTPEVLTYDELIELYDREELDERLQAKLHNLLTTPFVNNQAWDWGTRPLKLSAPNLGRYLRIAQWNIERGLEYQALVGALTNSSEFAALLNAAKYPLGSERRKKVLEEAALLSDSDVIVLNEVDWGMKRTGYRNVVADLAAALNMNYAYGAEFIEVDPIALGTEKFEGVADPQRKALVEQIRVDPELYKGLHGTAILSRFRLTNVRLVPYRTQGHDWYASEKNGVTRLEKGKRKVSELAFRQKISRETRRGGRMMLLADIEDPDIPQGRLTIAATHLESKTRPRNRLKQLEELLAEVKPVTNPVVIVGDMNTSTGDATPTSVRREIKKRFGSKKYWIEQTVKFLAGFSWPNRLLLVGLNEYRKQADPTVRSVAFVATNPEAKFFTALKNFRFADGGAFDFRGERQRSIGSGNSPLANSNQRGGKGFITTYEVERPIGFVGKFKLDWIFVKPPSLGAPYDTKQPYLFAPHFGRTLKALNYSIDDRISDHDPLIVDLPLSEPQIAEQAAPGRCTIISNLKVVL